MADRFVAGGEETLAYFLDGSGNDLNPSDLDFLQWPSGTRENPLVDENNGDRNFNAAELGGYNVPEAEGGYDSHSDFAGARMDVVWDFWDNLIRGNEDQNDPELENPAIAIGKA